MHKGLVFIALIFSTMFSTYLNATTITIGTGTATNAPGSYPAPYGNWFFGAKHQFLITAAELNAAGMSAGNINSLSFDVADTNNVALQGFTIAMKNTLTSSLTVFETGLTTVFTPQTYTEILGLNTHVFGAPFYWDGTSNILVETCFNNTSFTLNALTYMSSTAFTSTLYYRADNTTVCGSPFQTASVNNRPNMIFDWNVAAIPPIANFASNSTFTCSGLVNFSDLSLNNPTSWLWDFGDGDTSTAQNPSHTYLANGVYTVSLIACNAFGCDTITFNNYITVNLSAPTPIPASCTPNTLTYCCGFGMTNVTFNTINNNSNDGVDGYSDFTCTQTTVFEGQNYTLSIQTAASSTQNYAAWIDFNNDGVLNDVTERVFTASSQLNTSGSVSIPVGAVLNTPLRMRVSADYDFSAPPTSCSNLDYGQAEDFTVIITSNPNPPTPVFSASPTTTCSGTVCFTDLSLNAPTGWLWQFGDGNTSFQQSPCHTYTVDGVYTIILTVSNGNGSNTDSIVSYVTVNTANQLSAAACTPATSAYCCGYGILQVDFNTISNSTLDGVEGYKDYSCTNTTTVMEGISYLLSVKTGLNNAQDTRVWIDFNNDGSFNNTNELIMDVTGVFDPFINYIIPTGAVLNTALRMRISSDVVGALQSSCDANDFGQTEDYGVIIQQNTSPPTGFFTGTPTTTCSDSVCFTDLSIGAPIGWLWYFGDGNTSTLQNPCHLYATPGFYTVSLVVTNAFGQDSIAAVNYINVSCVVNMPPNGVASSTACNGTLYDDGGVSGNYSNNTDGIFVIQPTSATQVSLNFFFFDFRTTQPGDTLYIYDGPSIASPLISKHTGNANPGIINSTGGSITIRQKTNGFATDPGFGLNWSCTVGLNEVNHEDGFTVFPNPSTGIVNIKSNKNLNIKEVIIYNTMGQSVLFKTEQTTTNLIKLNLSHLPNGLYFLNIMNDEGVISKKITIQ